MTYLITRKKKVIDELPCDYMSLCDVFCFLLTRVNRRCSYYVVSYADSGVHSE